MRKKAGLVPAFDVWRFLRVVIDNSTYEDLSVKESPLPEQQGLYDPANEHDACGVGFVAHIKGNKSHSIIEQGLLILKKSGSPRCGGCRPLDG